MRNIFKYPPLDWRKRNVFCIPQGPNFTSAPRIIIPIVGSQLRLKAPRHSPHYSSVEQTHLSPGVDLLQDPTLRRFGTGVMANDHWGYATGLARTWAFWGPWMTGCKAELRCAVSVIGRQPGHEFAGVSFFHPKAFEMVLVQYLNDLYGHDDFGGENSHIPRRHGPVDWQRHRHLPVFSANFKIYHRGATIDQMTNPDHLFVFPITDQHFVEVGFRQHLYSRDKTGNLAFDSTPVQALQDAIFNSITVELSPEAQASYDREKADSRTLQLSKDFAPLQWPTRLYPAEHRSSASVATQAALLGAQGGEELQDLNTILK